MDANMFSSIDRNINDIHHSFYQKNEKSDIKL